MTHKDECTSTRSETKYELVDGSLAASRLDAGLLSLGDYSRKGIGSGAKVRQGVDDNDDDDVGGVRTLGNVAVEGVYDNGDFGGHGGCSSSRGGGGSSSGSIRWKQCLLVFLGCWVL